VVIEISCSFHENTGYEDSQMNDSFYGPLNHSIDTTKNEVLVNNQPQLTLSRSHKKYQQVFFNFETDFSECELELKYSTEG
jgi:hypothetical protein